MLTLESVSGVELQEDTLSDGSKAYEVGVVACGAEHNHRLTVYASDQKNAEAIFAALSRAVEIAYLDD